MLAEILKKDIGVIQREIKILAQQKGALIAEIAELENKKNQLSRSFNPARLALEGDLQKTQDELHRLRMDIDEETKQHLSARKELELAINEKSKTLLAHRSIVDDLERKQNTLLDAIDELSKQRVALEKLIAEKQPREDELAAIKQQVAEETAKISGLIAQKSLMMDEQTEWERRKELFDQDVRLFNEFRVDKEQQMRDKELELQNREKDLSIKEQRLEPEYRKVFFDTQNKNGVQ